MKKIYNLLIVLLLFALNIHGEEPNIIHNGLGFKYTPFIEQVCNYLKINNTQIIIKPIYSKAIAGRAVKLSSNYYIVYVNRQSKEYSTYFILAHELTHIQQDIYEEWDLTQPTTIITSYNIRYTNVEAEKTERKAMKNGYALSKKFNKFKYW